MPLAFMIAAAIAGLASLQSNAARPTSQNVWFYLTSDKRHWCATTSDIKARAAAANPAFASGMSAWLQLHGRTVESVQVSTESEDAYVEDTYTFNPNLRIVSVRRRGHYNLEPFFEVTFAPDKSGSLRLTRFSKMKVSKLATSQEVYFVDWPVYRRYADFPFVPLITAASPIAASQACPTTF
jgi:hypothetical protein